MNELEKAALSPEESVTPEPAKAENAVESNVQPAAEPAAAPVQEAVVDAPVVDPAECAELSDVIAREDDDAKAELRRLHALSKEELRDALKDIIKRDDMEAHREVTALKQVFFSIKSRENLEAYKIGTRI